MRLGGTYMALWATATAEEGSFWTAAIMIALLAALKAGQEGRNEKPTVRNGGRCPGCHRVLTEPPPQSGVGWPAILWCRLCGAAYCWEEPNDR
jgi:hypothetical protein